MTSKPIIPWIGGKSRLAKRILPLFPEHSCYVEPFAGGAALFFRKEPVDAEVLNDINGELVNLYRVVQHHLEEFVRQFKWALVSRDMYGWLNITRPETLTDVQRAARTIQGRMVISVNDIDAMRQAFAGLHLQTADITYTVGGAGRSSKTSELIITNYPT
ncbi:MAG: DNA adenine methylase [Rhodocyclaceae bacterium]|nr:DNA adenine methylase [Rhodocyclaceae bacterium]